MDAFPLILNHPSDGGRAMAVFEQSAFVHDESAVMLDDELLPRITAKWLEAVFAARTQRINLV